MRILKYIPKPQKPHWKIGFGFRAARDGEGARQSPDGASWCRLTKQTNSVALMSSGSEGRRGLGPAATAAMCWLWEPGPAVRQCPWPFPG